MLAGDHVPQLVVTAHARLRFALRVRADMRRADAAAVDGQASVRAADRGWHSDHGCRRMLVALVLTCDEDAWVVATVLTPPVRRGRVARVFEPAWELVA